jgi:hypothetical protein
MFKLWYNRRKLHMSKEDLVARVEALEKKLGVQASQDSSRKTLAAEIEAIEKRIEAMDGIEPPIDDLDMIASEDKDDDDDKEAKCASEKASGIEDEITQDRFTEVEGERHGEELATHESALAVGEESPTKPSGQGYVARLMKASERLDRVADYLEKNGRRELAFRIDKIADAIDSRIKAGGK